MPASVRRPRRAGNAMKAIRLLPWLALGVALAIVASGFGARFGLWDFRAGFAILRYGTYLGLAVAAVALIALLVPRTRAGNARWLVVSVVVALAASALPLSWLLQARSLPPINDITTDPANPPAFVAILPLRAGSPVSASYPGAATAEAQRKGYPDLKPIESARPFNVAFDHALATARDLGWQIVAADAAAGRIEATVTTQWFGFRDDVVIRVAPNGAGSRIDIRSVSRIGKGDLGANARRIRDFTSRTAR
jgi:uncharacterized protein (DUF1499 family)